MDQHLRVERGWIHLDGTRRDDGTIALGTGGEIKLSPFDAIAQRRELPVPVGGAIFKASVQRLAFWRR
jgi:hypothetical protein